MRMRESPSVLGINTLVHIPSFHAVYISTWHCKLLQDDSACYWLTSHFMSSLCASIQLFSHPSGILTPCISFHFTLGVPDKQELNSSRCTTNFILPSPGHKPPPSSSTVLQHKPFTSPKALQAAEQGLPAQISMPSFPSTWSHKEASGQISPDTWEILAAEPPCNAPSICFWRAGAAFLPREGMCAHTGCGIILEWLRNMVLQIREQRKNVFFGFGYISPKYNFYRKKNTQLVPKSWKECVHPS